MTAKRSGKVKKGITKRSKKKKAKKAVVAEKATDFKEKKIMSSFVEDPTEQIARERGRAAQQLWGGGMLGHTIWNAMLQYRKEYGVTRDFTASDKDFSDWMNKKIETQSNVNKGIHPRPRATVMAAERPEARRSRTQKKKHRSVMGGDYSQLMTTTPKLGT